MWSHPGRNVNQGFWLERGHTVIILVVSPLATWSPTGDGVREVLYAHAEQGILLGVFRNIREWEPEYKHRIRNRKEDRFGYGVALITHRLRKEEVADRRFPVRERGK